MPFIPLKLENLQKLDGGRVSVAFQQQLQRAVQDCIDRPGDDSVRTVALEVKFKPVIETNTGACEGASGTFHIKSKVPERKSKTYDFGVKQNGELFWSENSPTVLDQSTIDDADETGRVKRKHEA